MAWLPWRRYDSRTSRGALSPINRSRYPLATSASSVVPSARWKRLFGIQQVPAEYAVVPPSSSVFSSTNVDRPSFAPVTAAARPPAPVPRISRSTSSSHTACLQHLDAAQVAGGELDRGQLG